VARRFTDRLGLVREKDQGATRISACHGLREIGSVPDIEDG
jgi:hypothetical protein